MAGEGREAVILLDKSRIFVYTGNDFLGFDVPETVVRDIDIIDKSGFDSLVDTFIKTKRLNLSLGCSPWTTPQEFTSFSPMDSLRFTK